jgi:predicted acyl esterase
MRSGLVLCAAVCARMLGSVVAPAGASAAITSVLAGQTVSGQPISCTTTQYFGPTADQWARDGYAVVQLTARGFGDSCGTAASRLTDPTGCTDGYTRLDDERYEARDVQ